MGLGGFLGCLCPAFGARRQPRTSDSGGARLSTGLECINIDLYIRQPKQANAELLVYLVLARDDPNPATERSSASEVFTVAFASASLLSHLGCSNRQEYLQRLGAWLAADAELAGQFAKIVRCAASHTAGLVVYPLEEGVQLHDGVYNVALTVKACLVVDAEGLLLSEGLAPGRPALEVSHKLRRLDDLSAMRQQEMALTTIPSIVTALLTDGRVVYQNPRSQQYLGNLVSSYTPMPGTCLSELSASTHPLKRLFRFDQEALQAFEAAMAAQMEFRRVIKVPKRLRPAGGGAGGAAAASLTVSRTRRERPGASRLMLAASGLDRSMVGLRADTSMPDGPQTSGGGRNARGGGGGGASAGDNSVRGGLRSGLVSREVSMTRLSPINLRTGSVTRRLGAGGGLAGTASAAVSRRSSIIMMYGTGNMTPGSEGAPAGKASPAGAPASSGASMTTSTGRRAVRRCTTVVNMAARGNTGGTTPGSANCFATHTRPSSTLNSRTPSFIGTIEGGGGGGGAAAASAAGGGGPPTYLDAGAGAVRDGESGAGVPAGLEGGAAGENPPGADIRGGVTWTAGVPLLEPGGSREHSVANGGAGSSGEARLAEGVDEGGAGGASGGHSGGSREVADGGLDPGPVDAGAGRGSGDGPVAGSGQAVSLADVRSSSTSSTSSSSPGEYTGGACKAAPLDSSELRMIGARGGEAPDAAPQQRPQSPSRQGNARPCDPARQPSTQETPQTWTDARDTASVATTTFTIGGDSTTGGTAAAALGSPARRALSRPHELLHLDESAPSSPQQQPPFQSDTAQEHCGERTTLERPWPRRSSSRRSLGRAASTAHSSRARGGSAEHQRFVDPRATGVAGGPGSRTPPNCPGSPGPSPDRGSRRGSSLLGMVAPTQGATWGPTECVSRQSSRSSRVSRRSSQSMLLGGLGPGVLAAAAASLFRNPANAADSQPPGVASFDHADGGGGAGAVGDCSPGGLPSQIDGDLRARARRRSWVEATRMVHGGSSSSAGGVVTVSAATIGSAEGLGLGLSILDSDGQGTAVNDGSFSAFSGEYVRVPNSAGFGSVGGARPVSARPPAMAVGAGAASAAGGSYGGSSSVTGDGSCPPSLGTAVGSVSTLVASIAAAGIPGAGAAGIPGAGPPIGGSPSNRGAAGTLLSSILEEGGELRGSAEEEAGIETCGPSGSGSTQAGRGRGPLGSGSIGRQMVWSLADGSGSGASAGLYRSSGANQGPTGLPHHPLQHPQPLPQPVLAVANGSHGARGVRTGAASGCLLLDGAEFDGSATMPVESQAVEVASGYNLPSLVFGGLVSSGGGMEKLASGHAPLLPSLNLGMASGTYDPEELSYNSGGGGAGAVATILSGSNVITSTAGSGRGSGHIFRGFGAALAAMSLAGGGSRVASGTDGSLQQHPSNLMQQQQQLLALANGPPGLPLDAANVGGGLMVGSRVGAGSSGGASTAPRGLLLSSAFPAQATAGHERQGSSGAAAGATAGGCLTAGSAALRPSSQPQHASVSFAADLVGVTQLPSSVSEQRSSSASSSSAWAVAFGLSPGLAATIATAMQRPMRASSSGGAALGHGGLPAEGAVASPDRNGAATHTHTHTQSGSTGMMPGLEDASPFRWPSQGQGPGLSQGQVQGVSQGQVHVTRHLSVHTPGTSSQGAPGAPEPGSDNIWAGLARFGGLGRGGGPNHQASSQPQAWIGLGSPRANGAPSLRHPQALKAAGSFKARVAADAQLGPSPAATSGDSTPPGDAQQPTVRVIQSLAAAFPAPAHPEPRQLLLPPQPLQQACPPPAAAVAVTTGGSSAQIPLERTGSSGAGDARRVVVAYTAAGGSGLPYHGAAADPALATSTSTLGDVDSYLRQTLGMRGGSFTGYIGPRASRSSRSRRYFRSSSRGPGVGGLPGSRGPSRVGYVDAASGTASIHRTWDMGDAMDMPGREKDLSGDGMVDGASGSPKARRGLSNTMTCPAPELSPAGSGGLSGEACVSGGGVTGLGTSGGGGGDRGGGCGGAGVRGPPRRRNTKDRLMSLLTSLSQSREESEEEPADEHEWHDVYACVRVEADTGNAVVIFTQTEVTEQVEVQRKLEALLEHEHKVLESIFPRHVIEHMTLQAQHRNAGSGALGAAALGSSWANFRGSAMEALATSHSCVTILFCDIIGFTEMCKEVSAMVVMRFLNTLYMRFDELIDIYGVYKVETIGDCYMVAGGLVRTDVEGNKSVIGDGSEDALHAVRVMSFAKAIVREAAEVVLPTSGQPVQLRIGLHSGPVMSGIVGDKMPRFCLFGDTVNTASRMESTCPPGAIHVSADTRSLLNNEAWVATGGVQVKGKGLLETYVWAGHAAEEDDDAERRLKVYL